MRTPNQHAVRGLYLQRLGIVQYVSKDSSGVLLEEAEQSQALNIKKPSVENPAAVSSLLESLGESSEKLTVKSAKDTSDQISEPVSVELRFALWQATDDILVCCAINEPYPDPQEVTLLTNIVAAMVNQTITLPSADVITWPPHNNMQGDESEIRDYLSTLIHTRVSARSSKALLLMGSEIQQWLLSAEQREQAENGVVSMADGLTSFLVPSLKEMLHQSHLKRLTWQVISPYCAHL